MKARSYNIGIDLLKIIACVGVVFLHFGQVGKILDLSVPIFMFVSIFLTKNLIFDGAIDDFKKRIKRLYIPFVCWGVIYFVGLSIVEYKCNLFDLIMQLTIGVPANPPMYFIFLLILNTTLLYFVCHLFRWGKYLLVFAFALCLVLQYSGANVRMMQGISFHAQHSLGRFVELFPISILAYLYSICSGRGKWLLLICALAFIISFHFLELRLACPGFSYQGINLLLGTVVVCSLGIMSGEIITQTLPNCIVDKVKSFASLTAGIYYMHLLIGKILEFLFGRHRGIWEAVIVLTITSVSVYVIKKIRRISWLVV